MKQWKKVVAVLSAVALLVGLTPNQAYAEVNAEAMCQDTVEVIAATVTDETTSANGWAIFTTARAGKLTAEQADAYYANLETLLKTQDSSLLTESNTANIVAILAVTAIGKDATNVGGYNLLEPLADMSYNTGYVTTGATALIAMDSKNYTIPTVGAGGTQTTREALVQYLLDQRNSTGTWGYSYGGTDYASVDTIAMVIQALAPYYNSNADVKSAVDDGLAEMSAQQLADGGYGSACSEAQAIIALTSLGIDPLTDARFVKNGATLLDGLNVNYVQGQGFKGWDGNIDMAFSTSQAAYGLVAYQRFVSQKTSLFNMTDAVPIQPQEPSTAGTEATTGTEVTTGTEATTTEATTEVRDKTPKTGDVTPVVWLAGMALISITGMVIVNRKKQ